MVFRLHKETPTSSALLEAKAQGPALTAIHDFTQSIGSRLRTVDRLTSEVYPLLNSIPIDSDLPNFQDDQQEIASLQDMVRTQESQASSRLDSFLTSIHSLQTHSHAQIDAQIASIESEIRQIDTSLPHIDCEKVAKLTKERIEDQAKEAEIHTWIEDELVNILNTELGTLRREVSLKRELLEMELRREIEAIEGKMQGMEAGVERKDERRLVERYVVDCLQAVQDLEKTADPALRLALRGVTLRRTQQRAQELEHALGKSALALQVADCQRRLEAQLDSYLPS